MTGFDAGGASRFLSIKGSTPLEGARPLGGVAKRSFDLIVAVLAIVATAPLMLLISVVIAWSGGSPIFSHERVGLGGRRFGCLKFRTMRRDADQILKELLESDPRAKKAWLTHRKLRDDPRITPIGHFLRKSSLDELPQLFNILRGDMSFVGPRPVTADELEYYKGCVEVYASARPGLTGLWQISGRSNVSMERRVRMDVEYVRTWSLSKDVLIFLRTPFKLIRSNDSF
jgi:exopolysaccharide production protein ExoY